jgi:hypothetical protein
VVTSTLSTAAAMALALALAGSLGPTLGRWSADHRLARFLVGLLTELRMLPVLVALVPLLSARSGLPAFAIIGLLSGASRTAAVARWTSHGDPARRGTGWASLGAKKQSSWVGKRLTAAAAASSLHVTFEVALLEGLNTFFSAGRGPGLGAALVDGQLAAVLPLVALAWLATTLMERPAPRLRRAGP